MQTSSLNLRLWNPPATLGETGCTGTYGDIRRATVNDNGVSDDGDNLTETAEADDFIGVDDPIAVPFPASTSRKVASDAQELHT